MHAMTLATMYGNAGLARALHAFRSQPAAFPVHTSWTHVACINGKAKTGTRRLGEGSP